MMAARPIDPAPSELFSPVTLGRVSQVIVEQVRDLIRQGRLKPGDRLPSERDLCEQFGVSRVTVREALRILEAGGLVEVHVGARGGAFVTAPSSVKVGQELADLMQMGPTTASEIMEARMVFELSVIPLAVARADDAQVDQVRQLYERQRAALDSGAETMELSAAFHQAVAACTGNPAIEMLVRSFHDPLLLSLEEASASEPDLARSNVAEHGEFVAALELRDVTAATDALRRHFQRITDTVARVEVARQDKGGGTGG